MPGAKKNLYQKIIDHVFRPMHLGRLTMHLPDGQQMIYGDGQEGVIANIFIKDMQFFKKCVLYGDVGFGEAYVDGDWDTDDITKVVEWMILNVENHPTLMADHQPLKPVNFFKLWNKLQFALRANTISGSKRNISEHYDLGNEFYKTFLDSTMTYSSGYFLKSNQSLEDAQNQKYGALCQKLHLKPSDYVLEIGSGWGGFAVHAAKHYGCHVTTITISQEQYNYAKGRFEKEGLIDKIDIRLMDYRNLRGQYDKIVSIEMIEAVGHKFLETYFQTIHGLLKKDGLLALQMILCPDHRYDSFRRNVDWIQKYIFPGSLLPSMSRVMGALNKTGTMNLIDFEDLTPSYVKTLQLWRERFNRNLDIIESLGFDDGFVRKWNYYKSYCEAAFHMRNISVAQAVFSRPNNLTLNEFQKDKSNLFEVFAANPKTSFQSI